MFELCLAYCATDGLVPEPNGPKRRRPRQAEAADMPPSCDRARHALLNKDSARALTISKAPASLGETCEEVATMWGKVAKEPRPSISATTDTSGRLRPRSHRPYCLNV